jgi:hypothetical protein
LARSFEKGIFIWSCWSWSSLSSLTHGPFDFSVFDGYSYEWGSEVGMVHEQRDLPQSETKAPGFDKQDVGLECIGRMVLTKETIWQIMSFHCKYLLPFSNWLFIQSHLREVLILTKSLKKQSIPKRFLSVVQTDRLDRISNL